MSSMSSYSPRMKNISVAVKINNKILTASSPDIVVNLVEENKSRLNNVNITTAIHRIAKICHRRPQKIIKMSSKLKPLINLIFDRCGGFSGRQLANSTWGLSIMQYKNVEFYAKISEESRRKINDFEPQHLAILVWSFATMYIKDRLLFEKVATKAILGIQKFSPQNLSNLAWAFAKMNHFHGLLFSNIASQAVKSIKEFAPQNISNLIWSFASFKISDKNLIENIIDESLKRLEEFNTQNLSNLSWSIAVLTPSSELNKILFEEIAATSLVKMDYFNERYLSNLIWSLIVVGHYPERLIESAISFMNSVGMTEIEDMSMELKSQWYQVDLALRLERPAFSQRIGLRKEILRLVSRDFLKSEITCSEDGVELNNILNFLKMEHTCNFILDEGFVVSNMLHPESQKTALVYWGEDALLRGSSKAKGQEILRLRLLRASGWRVSPISFVDLNAGRSFEAKLRMVAARISACGIPAGPLASANTGLDIGLDGTLSSSPGRERAGRSILEGIVYKTYSKRYMRILLYDVEITRALGGRFGVGFYFELVDINLIESVAAYFQRASDPAPAFVHPVKVR